MCSAERGTIKANFKANFSDCHASVSQNDIIFLHLDIS